jgi:hypothetical protein
MGALLVGLVLSASVTHTRLETAQGPVHVLEVGAQPKFTVLYVHGYWTDVDTAWREHHLQEQLVASGLEAVFIVPEAPSGPGQKVRWANLDSLLAVVSQSRGTLPTELIALGHSGAARTLAQWTSASQLHTLVLLDAFYVSASTWTTWLEADPTRHVFVLSRATASRAAAFCATPSERIECRASSESHMGIITNGTSLPFWIARAAASTAQTVSVR